MNHLPHDFDPLASLIGRAKDTSDALGHMHQSDLLVISGPPGVGKSSFAKRLCATWSARFPEVDTALVDLQGCTTQGDVKFLLCQALGCNFTYDEDHESFFGRVAHWISNHAPMILLLDNATWATQLTKDVLRHLHPLRNLKIIVTSSDAGAFPHQDVIRLEPLSQEEAKTLLAHMSNPCLARSLASGQGEIDALDRLLENIGTLPMTLNMVAPYLRLLPPSVLEERTAALLTPTLDHPGLTLNPFELALASLAPLERQVLECCCVFASSPALPMVEAMAKTQGLSFSSLASTLHELYQKSLLRTQHQDSGVVVNVYTSIRGFTLGQMDPARRLALDLAHADLYAQHLRQDAERGMADSKEALLWIKANLNDVRQALRTLCVHDPSSAIFCLARYYEALIHLLPFFEYEDLLDLIVKRSTDADTLILAHCGLSNLSHMRLKQEPAHHHLSQAQALPPTSPHAQLELALTHFRLHKASRSAEDLEALLAEIEPSAKASGMEHYAYEIKHCLFWSSHAQDRAAGLPALLRLLDEIKAIHCISLEINLLHSLGVFYLRKGHEKEAYNYFNAVQRLAGETGNSQLQSLALFQLSSIKNSEDQTQQAKDYILEGIRIVRKSGGRTEEYLLELHLCSLLIDEGHHDQAHHLLTQIADKMHTLQDATVHYFTLRTLGTLSHVQGDLSLGAGRYREALDLVPSHMMMQRQITTFYLTICLLQQGLEQQAIESFSLIQATDIRPSEPLFAALAKKLGLSAHADPPPPAMSSKYTHAMELITHTGPTPPPRPSPPCWFILLPLWELYHGQSASMQEADSHDLIVHGQGLYFEIPGQPRVDLTRRGPMKLLLTALVHSHHTSPTQSLSLDELFALGWPDEPHVALDFAYKRVYAAIGTLRRLGLRDLLVTTDTGYRLRPEASVNLADPPK